MLGEHGVTARRTFGEFGYLTHSAGGASWLVRRPRESHPGLSQNRTLHSLVTARPQAAPFVSPERPKAHK
jgi:hypothetical protein